MVGGESIYTRVMSPQWKLNIETKFVGMGWTSGHSVSLNKAEYFPM